MMLCDICHKNEAVFHFREIVGSEKKELNLCSDCVSEHHLQLEGDSPQELSEILTKLGKLIDAPGLSAAVAALGAQESAPAPADAPEVPVCPGCGWTPRRFRETGRFGCEQCYEVFAEELEELLPRLHRGAGHVGKHPGTLAPEAVARLERAELRRRLDEAVRDEDYECAARLRDRLRELSFSEESTK